MTRPQRTWLGALGALLSLVGFATAAGLPGAAAGLGVAVAWFALPVPYTLAIGHVALVAVTPETAPLVRFAPVEAGFAGLLCSEAPALDRPLAFVAAALLSLVALGAIAWGGLAWSGALWGGALALALLAALLAYGLHRYERLALDLLEATP